MRSFLRSNKGTVIMLAVLIFLLYATRPDHTPAATNEAVYTAIDNSFAGPNSLPAGWTNIRIENKGNDLHNILLVQLLGGKTRADFEAALRTDPKLAKPPKWIKYAGGPNAVIPGETVAASVEVSPGNYLLICMIPDSKGVLHAAQGMIKNLTVTPPSKKSSAEPKAARVITLSDYSFAVPKPLAAGIQTIEVQNKGTQNHEVVLVELSPNATAADFGRHFLPDAGSPPPGKPIGGVAGLGKGGRAYFTADLKPGRYGLICFMPDTAGNSRPYFTRGMTADFTIHKEAL